MLILLTQGYTFLQKGYTKEDIKNGHEIEPAAFHGLLQQENFDEVLEILKSCFGNNSEQEDTQQDMSNVNVDYTDDTQKSLHSYHIGLTYLLMNRRSDSLPYIRQAVQQVSGNGLVFSCSESLDNESHSFSRNELLKKSTYMIELASVYILNGSHDVALKLNYEVLQHCYSASMRSLVTDLGIRRFCNVDDNEYTNTIHADMNSLDGSSKAIGYAVTDEDSLLRNNIELESVLSKKVSKDFKYKRLALICRALNNIATSYCEIGKFTTAYATLQEAQALLEKSAKLSLNKKPHHKDNKGLLRIQQAILTCNMGYVQLRLQKYIEAINLFEEANFLVDMILGKNHKINVLLLDHLGSAYAKQGFFADAITVYEKLHDICEQTEIKISSLKKIAYIHIKEKRFEGARLKLDKVLEYLKSSNGGEIDIHIESTKNLIAALEDEYVKGDELIVQFRSSSKNFVGSYSTYDFMAEVDSFLDAPVEDCIIDIVLFGPLNQPEHQEYSKTFFQHCRTVNDTTFSVDASTGDIHKSMQESDVPKPPNNSFYYSSRGLEIEVFATNNAAFLESSSDVTSSNDARTLAAKAQENFASKKFKLAVANFTLTMELLEQNDLSDNKFYSCVLQDLAISKVALGLYKDALSILNHAFGMRRGLSEEATIAAKLGVIYFELNESQAAISHLRHALKVSKENKMDLLTASVLMNMAIIMVHLKSWEEVELLLNECILIQNLVMEPSALQTLQSMSMLAFAKVKLSKDFDALNIYATIMRRLKFDFAKNKLHCEEIVNLMNAIYIRKGLFDAAIDNFKGLLRYYHTHQPNDVSSILSIEKKLNELQEKQTNLVFV